MIMMCQCRNQCNTLVGDVNSGGGYSCVGGREYGKFLYLVDFAVNLKLSPKEVFKYKKQ